MIMLAYQVRGYHSSKRRGSFWRPFQLRKIDNITVTDEIFSVRVREGFRNVSKLIRGESLLSARLSDPYDYFRPEICGPVAPAYLASTPSLMMRIVGHSVEVPSH